MKKDFDGKSDGQVVLEYLGYCVVMEERGFRLKLGCNCNCPRCSKLDDVGAFAYVLERDAWQTGVQDILTLEFLIEQADTRGWCFEIRKGGHAPVWSKVWISRPKGDAAVGTTLAGNDVASNIIASLAAAIKIEADQQ